MDERSPLMQFPGTYTGQSTTAHLGDHHHQFCHLVGVRPYNLPPGQKHEPHPESLYMRATRHRRSQAMTYAFTATLTNGMLLSQVVLGAALTALGASDSSRVLITIFGALNTVIAGLVAFLKSRGQPVRARMFRDDLDRVVDEIENSAVMWLGISRNAHGYDAIDTDDQVTVRSEVARLTRLYDRAVKTNTMNDPDMYAAGQPGDPHAAALRKGPTPAPAPVPAAATPTPAVPLASSTAPIAVDPDDSPATKAPSPPTPPPPAAKPAEDPKPAEEAKPADPAPTPATPAPATPAPATETPAPTEPATPAAPAPAAESTPAPPDPAPAPAPAAPAAAEDPDESPATAAHPKAHEAHDNSKPASLDGSEEGKPKDSLDPKGEEDAKPGAGI